MKPVRLERGLAAAAHLPRALLHHPDGTLMPGLVDSTSIGQEATNEDQLTCPYPEGPVARSGLIFCFRVQDSICDLITFPGAEQRRRLFGAGLNGEDLRQLGLSAWRYLCHQDAPRNEPADRLAPLSPASLQLPGERGP